MSDKNLITKSELNEVKAAEALLADNLHAHANASLSKAHGIQLLNLTKPTLDTHGNDISVYCDSNGDRVGYYFMRLTYGNVCYYAPLELSALSGKDPSTGVSAPASSTAGAPSSTAWVSDFTSQDEQDLVVTNSSVLLPHTRLAHWETHSGGLYQIMPQITLDSAGHVVGNYVAVLLVDGVELNIPCDSRLGGPVQFPRSVTVSPSALSWHFGEGEGYGGGSFCTAAWQGTAPCTVVWQLQSAGSTWADLTNPDGTTAGTKTSYDGRLRIAGYASHSAFGSTFVVTSVLTKEGRNNGVLRVLVTNSQGSASASATLYARDETSCAVFSSGVETGLLPFSDFRTALHFRMSKDWLFANDRVWGGYLVAGKRLRPHVLAKDWIGRWLCRHVLRHVAQGMRWRMHKTPFRLWSAAVLCAYCSTLFAVYWLNKKEADAEMESMGKFSLMQMYHRRLKRLRKDRVKE